MRYAEFRDQLEDALRQEGLFFTGADRRVENIELADTVRSWKAYVSRGGPGSTEPFHVSAVIGFKWRPVDAARACTSEEDLLTELVGRSRAIASNGGQMDASGSFTAREPSVWFHYRNPRGVSVRRMDRCRRGAG